MIYLVSCGDYSLYISFHTFIGNSNNKRWGFWTLEAIRSVNVCLLQQAKVPEDTDYGVLPSIVPEDVAKKKEALSNIDFVILPLCAINCFYFPMDRGNLSPNN